MKRARPSRRLGGMAAFAVFTAALITVRSAEPVAAEAIGPGGVPGAMLWLRADAGVSRVGADISTWADQSSSGLSVTGVNTPTWADGGWNFNPSVSLTRAAGEYFTVPSGFADFTAGLSTFVVHQPTATPANGYERLIDFGGGPESDNLLLMRVGSTSDVGLEAWQGSARPLRPQALGFTTNERHLLSVGLPAGAAGATVTPTIRVTGATRSLGVDSNVPSNVTRTSNFIGKSNWGADDLYSGGLPELIMFNSALSATDRSKVESYLAAKYGMTLDQSAGQSYLASNGTTKMWDHTATDAATFNQNITVIGRDDDSGLVQRQSKNVASDAMVTLVNGTTVASTNSGNTSSFAADRSFLSIADSGAAISSWTTTERPGAGWLRVAREWKVQEVGSVGTVTISVPGSTSSASSKLPSSSSPMYMLVDADGDFSSGATSVALTASGSDYRATLDRSLGSYVTFASFVTPATPPAPDLDAASDTGVSSTDNITADATPSVRGTCTTGNTIRFSVDGEASAGVATCSGGVVTWTFATLIEGNHAIRYTATDPTYGGESAASPPLNITVDTVAPAAPSVAPDLDASSDTGSSSTDNLTSDTTPTFVVSCTTGTRLTLLIDGVSKDTGSCSGGAGTLTASSAIASGLHAATFTHGDTAGNASSTSPALAFTVDTSSPATPGVAPDLDASSDTGASATDNVTSDTTPLIVATCVSGTRAAFFVDLVQLGSAVACTGGEAQLVLPALADGVRAVLIRELDDAGNASGVSPTLTLTIDAVAPANPTAAPDLDDASDLGDSFTDDLTSDATPMVMASCAAGESVRFSSDGTSVGAPVACASGTATLVLPTLAEGDREITFDRIDAAGNASAISPTLTITIDTTPPVAPTSIPDLLAVSDSGFSNTDEITSASATSITVSCVDGHTVHFLADSERRGFPVMCSGNAASHDVPLPDDGTFAITFTETDEAGNVSDESPALTVTIDRNAPTNPSSAPDLAASSDTGVSNSDNITADTTPLVVAPCESGSRVVFIVDGVQSGSPVECADGSAGASLATLSSGVHSVKFIETDASGNPSEESPALSVTIDGSAPANPTVAPDLADLSDTGVSNEDEITTDDTPRFAVVCGTGNTVTVLVDGDSVGTTTCVAGAAEVVAPQLPEGTYSVTFTEADALGNTSGESPSLSIRIDRTAPSAPAGAPDLAAESDTGASGIDDVTSSTELVFAAACSASNTVRFVVDGVQQGLGVACVDAVAESEVLLESDGTYEITFTETDAAGNVSDESPGLTVTVDRTAPSSPSFAPDLAASTDTGASDTDDITADTTPTFVVGCSAGTSVLVFVDGVAYGVEECSVGSATVLSTVALGVGERIVTYRQVDDAGNQSPESPELAILIDGSAPVDPTVAPDLADLSDTGVSNDDEVTADDTPRFAVVCGTGNTVTLLVDGDSVGAATCVAGAAEVVALQLSEGTRAVTFLETDAAGNTSGESPSLSIRIDLTSPSTPALAPDLAAGSDTGASDTDDVTSSTELGFTVGCSAPNTVRFVIDGGQPGSGVACSDDVAESEVLLESDGTFVITFTETDAAGNVSDESPGLAVTVDRTAPTSPSTAPDLAASTDTGASDTDDITADTTPTFEVACASENEIRLLVDGVVNGTETCSGEGAAIAVSSSLGSGERSITFVEVDDAGNETPESPSLIITIDGSAPADPTAAPDLADLSDTGASNEDEITTDDTPRFAVVCVTGNTVTVLVDGDSVGTATCVAGAAEVVAPQLEAGAYSVTSTETDPAGNTSGESPALSVRIDLTAPSAPAAAPDLAASSDTGLSDTDDVTLSTELVFTAACSASNTVRFVVDGVQQGLGVACADDVAESEVLLESDGTFVITFTETDPAGNVSDESPGLTVMVDRTAPFRPSIAPDLTSGSDTGVSDTDDITAETTPTFEAACETDNTVVLFVDGAVNGTETCSGGAATIAVTSALGVGERIVTYREVDDAGNESPESLALTITIDPDATTPTTTTTTTSTTSTTSTTTSTTTTTEPTTTTTTSTLPPTTTTSTTVPPTTTTTTSTTVPPTTTTTSTTTTTTTVPPTTTTTSTTTTVPTSTVPSSTTTTVPASTTTTAPTSTTVPPVTVPPITVPPVGPSTPMDLDGDLVFDPIDVDDDNDLIDDAAEDLAPNGDGNGDGIADRRQATVATVANPITGSFSTLTVETGSGCAFRSARVLDGAETPSDGDRTYPVGLFDYELRCVNPGASVDVTILVGSADDSTPWVARKYVGDSFVAFDAVFATETIGSRSVRSMTFTVVDGGIGDDDGTANGIIVDPIGPSIASAEDLADVPSLLAQTGGGSGRLVLWSLLFIGVGSGAVAARRRRLTGR